jgi:uroporphyrinogen-III synthase
MGEVPKSGFDGLRVLSFESRRGAEMTRLIANAGGVPTVVASMREVPLEDNHEALEFVRELVAGKVDTVVFLTGVGAQVVLRVAESANQRDAYLEALKKIPVVARGPKPVSVLRPLGVPIALTAPEPNTWRELLQALDANGAVLPLRDKVVAVQEYGATNDELLTALHDRGARIRRVPVYDWQLPEDVGPLRSAVQLLVQRQIDVVFFTTSVQVRHLMLVAGEMKLADEVCGAMTDMFVASIGPVTSDELRRNGLPMDMEPSHPKMGFLVSEAAAKAGDSLRAKRRGSKNQMRSEQ